MGKSGGLNPALTRRCFDTGSVPMSGRREFGEGGQARGEPGVKCILIRDD